jgi:hypothetical protein
MGVYRYTLRKETKVIDGLVIGRFGFAYKESFWSEGGAYKRRVAQALAAAERARYDLPDLRYAIMGEFKDCADQPYAVFDCDTKTESFSDTKTPGVVVGHIRKVGRKYVFTPLQAKLAA